MADLLPFAIRVDLTAACRTMEDAAELFDVLAEHLPPGTFLEGGACELMKPRDVIAASPLAEALQAEG